MKKIYLIILFVAFTVASGRLAAQGTLQFNQALIIDNNLYTVPAGKVWKVDAIYGKQSNVCLSTDPLYTGYSSKAMVSGMYVNGVEVLSSRKFLSTNLWSLGCGTNYGSGYNLAPLDFESDPNVLPIWLPAGTTVQSIGSGVFLSVLEFNVIP